MARGWPRIRLLSGADVRSGPRDLIKQEARFPTVKSLDSFEFAAIPSLNKTLALELARCEHVARRENVIAVGNSGTGKTHIALGFGAGGLPGVFSSRDINFPQFRHLRRATPVPICTPITREAMESGSQATHCWRETDSNCRSPQKDNDLLLTISLDGVRR
jgi:IstB-like ATP binding protein